MSALFVSDLAVCFLLLWSANETSQRAKMKFAHIQHASKHVPQPRFLINPLKHGSERRTHTHTHAHTHTHTHAHTRTHAHTHSHSHSHTHEHTRTHTHTNTHTHTRTQKHTNTHEHTRTRTRTHTHTNTNTHTHTHTHTNTLWFTAGSSKSQLRLHSAPCDVTGLIIIYKHS